jgi:branched-chain amino acid transport system ATP-binding protein
MSPLIATKDLSVGYDGRAVVSGINIEVHAGEIVVLLGANGAGKTTTLLTLCGELAAIDGGIDFMGAPAQGGLATRIRQGMAFLPEERGVFRRLTVNENLRLGRASPSKAYEFAPELLALSKKKVGLCSGGEQQIVCLARALAAEPRILMADEISLGLAPKIVKRMLTEIRRAADAGSGALIVEQHAAQALAVADRAYVIQQGRITISDTAAALRERLHEIEAAYLGTSLSAEVT